jgi:hypothetical protein
MVKVERRSVSRAGGLGRFAAGVIVGAGLSSVLASAAQFSRHDGVYWSRLENKDKVAYVAGYGDAMQTSLGKLDSLRLAAGVFHWKGADKALRQVVRELDTSRLPADELVGYLNGLYSNPRYGDFNVATALELAAMRGIDPKTPSDKAQVDASDSSGVKR